MVLTGREKATIFLSMLGAETSSRLLRYLPNELADLIAAGINHLPTPSPEALSEVLEEFRGFLSLPEAAQNVPKIESRPSRPAPVRRNYPFLTYERPQIAAFMLANLPEENRPEILAGAARERAVIEELLVDLKPTPFSAKIFDKLKVLYGIN